MLIGAVMVAVGIWWYIPGAAFNTALVTQSTLTNLQSLVALFQGGLGIFLVLVGGFVVWIERDELRIRREMEARDIETEMEQDLQPASTEQDESDGHVCDACGKSFDSERGLNIHKGQKH